MNMRSPGVNECYAGGVRDSDVLKAESTGRCGGAVNNRCYITTKY